MHDFVEPACGTRANRRPAGVRYSSLGMTALLLAGLLVPAPGNIAIAAIAAVGLVVMGAQHVILHRPIAKSAELIATQEALLAAAATSPRRPEVSFPLVSAEARAGRDGVRNGKASAHTRGRRLAA